MASQAKPSLLQRIPKADAYSNYDYAAAPLAGARRWVDLKEDMKHEGGAT